MLVKIRKKSVHWWRHGKHRSVLMEIRALQKRRKRVTDWKRSIRELFDRG